METKFKKLTPFEKLVLGKINKELKRYFEIFFDSEVKDNNTYFSEVSETLINNYVVLKNFEVDFLNKKEEIEFPFLIQWKLGIKDDTIFIYLTLEDAYYKITLLEWNDFKRAYSSFIETKEATELLNKVGELLDNAMKVKGYNYKIITNKVK